MLTLQTFGEKLNKEIEANSYNNYTDNWDYTLFGTDPKPKSTRTKISNWLRRGLRGKFSDPQSFKSLLQPHLEGMDRLSHLLEDEYSKDLLIKLLAHRLLGHTKVKLPLSTPAYWKLYAEAESCITDKTDFIDPGFRDFRLYKHQLDKLGYPIQLYFMSFGVLVDFIIKQYEFNRDGIVIKAEKGDVVIDAGGCWGDTALYFANEAGEQGKVYSFEFIPNNITLFKKNTALNPALSKRIELVQNPLWNVPGKKIFYKDAGPASRISFKNFITSTGRTQTQTIDNFVKEAGITKVDFIKMDIEGAEMNSLKGSRETLLAFKPKLAIAVYHDLADFYTIAEYLNGLNVGYKFYLEHYTIHSSETVLYATV